jgi:nicotinamidase/pyrazinamidase
VPNGVPTHQAEPVTYDARTALLVVDVQNDFADPKGSLSVRGGDAVVPIVSEEARRAAAGGAFVAYTQDWHPATTPHFAKDGGIWPVHCVAGTWGAWLHPGVVILGPTIRKGSNGEDGYSGFTMRDPVTGGTTSTQLEGLLRDHAIERVVIGGLATDYCVKATALDAVRLGFETTVLVDAIAAVDLKPGDGDRALDELRGAGVRIAHSGAGDAGGAGDADGAAGPAARRAVDAPAGAGTT